jgi:hypothetical protein
MSLFLFVAVTCLSFFFLNNSMLVRCDEMVHFFSCALQIRGKRNFEILSELKEALEIKSSFKRQDKPPAQ